MFQVSFYSAGELPFFNVIFYSSAFGVRLLYRGFFEISVSEFAHMTTSNFVFDLGVKGSLISETFGIPWPGQYRAAQIAAHCGVVGPAAGARAYYYAARGRP